MKTLIALTLLACSFTLAAQTTTAVPPSMDNTIFSESDLSNGGGENLFLGVTQDGDERRSLLAFEDLSAIPAGSTITEVTLEVTVNRSRGAAIGASLFAVTTPWGEGSSMGGSGGGQGGEAGSGDATWNFAMVDQTGNTAWQTPGGDFAQPALSSSTVPTSGTATFASSPALVAAVQSWLDGTADNFGLIMVADNTTPGNAKRFASREGAAANQPVLNVTYTVEISDTPLVASGLWYVPALQGDGFNIIESPALAGKGVAANLITVFYYGYDADGARLWLISESLPGPFLLNKTMQFPLLVGGTSGNFQTPPPQSELTNWGTLDVTLDSCTSGQFVLNGADGIKTFDAVQLVPIDGTSCSVARQR